MNKAEMIVKYLEAHGIEVTGFSPSVIDIVGVVNVADFNMDAVNAWHDAQEQTRRQTAYNMAQNKFYGPDKPRVPPPPGHEWMQTISGEWVTVLVGNN